LSDPYRTLPTQTLLRRVAVARARGDWTQARPEWHACIARAKPRVEAIVDIQVARALVPSAERDDVVQEALNRVARRLVHSLDKLTEDSFLSSVVTATKLQCIDHHRRRKVATRGEAGSLDERAGWAEGESDRGRFDKAVAEQSTLEARREEEQIEAERAIADAIPRLNDPRARAILMADRVGSIPDDELARQLGVSTTNLYKIRSRALVELRGLIEP
jgi:RNA polymerase sigma factor (sigma-70 family)